MFVGPEILFSGKSYQKSLQDIWKFIGTKDTWYTNGEKKGILCILIESRNTYGNELFGADKFGMEFI